MKKAQVIQTVVIGVSIIVRKNMRDYFLYSLATGNNLKKLEESVAYDIKEEVAGILENDNGEAHIKELPPFNFRTDKCQSLHMSYRNRKACFGIGNDSTLIGASIAAGEEIMKKEKMDYVPRADMEVIVKGGRVLHNYALSEYLIND